MMKDESISLPALRQGDERAVRRLVDAHSARIYNVARRILRNPQDAEDAVQETFLTALDKLEQFDGRASFLTWLYRIAVNTSLMALRKRRTRQRKEEPLELPSFEALRGRELLDWSADPSRKLLRRELQQVMDRALDRLPEKYRVVFVLRDLEGLSTEQTGKVLGITPNNVKVRLLRARLFLREQLDRYFHEHEPVQVKA
jgi:RNA polymerase sigma-70 factor (ECF subfamily)